MPNGKCYLHGGRTPSGDDWHKPLWPPRTAPDAPQKLNAKLQKFDRDAQRRTRDLAAASAEDRAKREEWKRTHAPGSAAKRQRLKKEREDSVWAREVSAQPAPEPPAELRELQDALAKSRERLAELESRAAASASAEIKHIGVFE